MKKLISAILMITILSIALPTFAQTRYYNESRRSGTYSSRNYNDRGYYGQYQEYGQYQQPNIYDRHRKVANIVGGVGAGALLGALLGGKKGALIGAAVGAAGGAIMTAKQSPRNNRYRRY